RATEEAGDDDPFSWVGPILLNLRLGRPDTVRALRQRLENWAREPNRDPGALNNLAWQLIEPHHASPSDTELAVKVARKSVELAPQEANYWNTFGVAQYRAGGWKAAIEALEKSQSLAPDKQLAFDGFFLAMAHWQTGQKDMARRWFGRAVD